MPRNEKVLNLKIGESLEVKTPQERSAAHRFALMDGIAIATRRLIIGKGYEIVRVRE